MLRKELAYLREGDEWRDYLITLLRSDEMRELLSQEAEPVAPEDLVEVIKHYWSSKPDKGAERFWKAATLKYKLEEMVENGKTLAQAKQEMARDEGHNSVVAFEKWMQRNFNGNNRQGDRNPTKYCPFRKIPA